MLITQLFLITKQSPKWHLKGILIYFSFLLFGGNGLNGSPLGGTKNGKPPKPHNWLFILISINNNCYFTSQNAPQGGKGKVFQYFLFYFWVAWGIGVKGSLGDTKKGPPPLKNYINDNNSVICHHKMLPKVANERYCHSLYSHPKIGKYNTALLEGKYKYLGTHPKIRGRYLIFQKDFSIPIPLKNS